MSMTKLQSDKMNKNNQSRLTTAESDIDTIETNLLALPPIGGIIAWHKQYYNKHNGSATSTSAYKLIDSAATFKQDGIEANMIIRNSTDATYSYVVSVDSDTQLTIYDDIMASGENYYIYATPKLTDNWVECNGQILDDEDSPYDGQTIPDLNGDGRFLRGNAVSGTEQDGTRHPWIQMNAAANNLYWADALITPDKYDSVGGASANMQYVTATGASGTSSNEYYISRPVNMSVVWIMRIK